MHQKELAKQAWEQAGLYRSSDRKLRDFLRHVEELPGDCWPELVQEVRDKYPDYKERLAIPLWETGDKLLRLNLIRAANPALKDETDLLRKFVRRADPQEDMHELRAVVNKDHPQLLEHVARKKGIDPGFKNQVQLHQERLKATRS